MADASVAVGAALDQARADRRRGLWAAVARTLEQVRDASVALPDGDPLRTRVAAELAEAWQVIGSPERARALASTALRDAEAHKQEAVLPLALRVVGAVTWRTGNLRAARPLLETAVARARQVGSAEDAVQASVELSHIALDQGRIDDADALLRDAIALGEGDPVLSLLPLPALANTYQRRADRERARAGYEEALTQARAAGHRMAEGMAQQGLANLALEQGDVRIAIARIREAHRAYSDVGYTYGEAQCYNVLGEAWRRSGDGQRAVRAYEQAVRKGDDSGHAGLVPRANLAVLRLESGRKDDARVLIEQVLEAAEARGLRPLVASMHALLLPCLVDDPEKLHHHLVRASDALVETGIYDRDLAMAARTAAIGVGRPELAARCRAVALRQWRKLDDASEAREERRALHELAQQGAPIPAGPFDLVQPLGQGAMGEVWRARHRLGFDAAVKVVAAAPRRERLLALLEEEARAVVGLEHPNIVRLIDFGSLGEEAEAMRPQLHATAPWFAMELVPGGSLEEKCGRMPWAACREILLQLLDALAHAHSRGVLHLDVKPANVLLSTEGEAKLVDFGLAAVLSAAGGRVRVVGTPLYMAPEQFRGEPRDWGPWTDLYALGALAVHLVGGAPPFDGADLREIRDGHLRGTPRIVVPPGVPQGFDAWVRGLLSKEPADRFAFAADAADALRWLDEGAVTAPLPLTTPRIELSPDRARSGLALFDLRRPPLVARADERQALWASVRAVATELRPRVVVLRGSAGVGKTALARWVAERAHAEAQARTWHAPDVEDPVGALVAGRLRVEGMEVDAAERRIAGLLPLLDEADVTALAALGTGVRDDGMRMDAALGAVVRLLEHDARDRPVLVHVEAPLYRESAIAGLAALVLQAGLPVLVLLELRPDDVPTRERGELVPGAEELEVLPLPADATRELLLAMLPLHADLAVAITERAAGNPRLALHLLGSLIRRDAVAVGSTGVALRAGVQLDLPEDVAALWRDRLDEVLAGLGDEAWAALAVGALLGSRVDLAEWREACERAGLRGTSAVLRAMRRARLALATADRGWQLAHPVVRDVVIAEAKARGLYEAVCRAAASAPSVERDPGRRGELLADGGSLQAAGGLLRRGAELALDRGDVVRARALIDRCGDVLRALGADEGSPVWAGVWLLRCRIAVEEGQAKEGEEHAERLLVLARRHDLRDVLPDALRWMANIDWIAGRVSLALDGYRDALAAFAAIDDPLGEARCHHGIAVVERARARFDVALEHLERARELLEMENNEQLGIAVYCSIGDLRRRQGRFDEAQAAFGEALRLAQGAHDTALASIALLGLGELARKRGDLDAAEGFYRDALRMRGGGQRLKTASAQLNLALVLLMRGRHDQAEAALNELIDRLGREDHNAIVQWARVALLPVVAVRSDAEWTTALNPVIRVLSTESLCDPDVAWCLEQAGERAASVGRNDRARWCFGEAAEHWRRLGDEARADALAARR